MTNEELEGMNDEQRAAWMASLNADETLILQCPAGYRFNLVAVSYLKRVLATRQMTIGDQLEFLEALNGMVDERFTTEGLALVKPADDISAQMIEEARKLDADDSTLSRSFDVLTSWEVFGNLVRLNPTIMDAMKACGLGGWGTVCGSA